MEPGSVQAGENIDQNKKGRDSEDRCNGARQVCKPIRHGPHPRGHPVAHEQCQSAYPVAAPSRTDRFFSQGLVAFREHMTIEGWRAGSYRAFFFKRARVRFTVR